MVDIGHKDNIRKRKVTKRDRGEIHKREGQTDKRERDKQRGNPQKSEGQTEAISTSEIGTNREEKRKAVVCVVDHNPRYA